MLRSNDEEARQAADAATLQCALVQGRALCGRALEAWKRAVIEARKATVRARLCWQWRLQRRCWAAWATMSRDAQVTREVQRHEQHVRQLCAAHAIAAATHRRRLLGRCLRQWYTWRQAQARGVGSRRGGAWLHLRLRAVKPLGRRPRGQPSRRVGRRAEAAKADAERREEWAAADADADADAQRGSRPRRQRRQRF